MTSSCTQDCRGLLQLTPTVTMTPCTSHQLVLGPDIKTNDCSQSHTPADGSGFCFCGVWEEAGEASENPGRHWEDMQTPHRKIQKKAWNQTHNLLAGRQAKLTNHRTSYLIVSRVSIIKVTFL